MKSIQKFIVFQLISSAISGLLISKMSIVGKVGITLFHQEYGIFKSFWQTTLLLFILQCLFLFVVYLLSLSKYRQGILITLVMLILLSLGVTIFDFQTNTTHKLLKGYFHTGFYLFWLSMMISVFGVLLFKKTTIFSQKFVE